MMEYFSANENKDFEIPHQHVFGFWDGDPNVSPFQIQKFRRAFQIHDVTVDGKVSVEDYVSWGQRAAKTVGVEWNNDLQKSWENCFEA